MKKIIYILVLIILASCKSKHTIATTDSLVPYSRFVKVPIEEAIPIKTSLATDLGRRLLETCNTSRFKAFTRSEATEKVIQNATVDKITETCRKINNRNGRFIGIQLIEITHDIETDDYTFKYKIEYQKKYFDRELNVVVNSENKVSAINTKEIPNKNF